MTYLVAEGLELRVVPDSHNVTHMAGGGARGRAGGAGQAGQGRHERGKAQIRRLIMP